MKQVIVPAALAELQDAADYYASQGGPGLAHMFVDEFERVVNLVLSNPHLGAAFRGGRRRYFLSRFPYSVIYQLTADELRIIAVAHHRRRPAYWRARR